MKKLTRKTKFCWHCGKKMRGNSPGITVNVYSFPRLFHKQCSKSWILNEYERHSSLFGW